MGNETEKQEECNRYIEKLEEMRRQREREKEIQKILIKIKAENDHYERQMANLQRLIRLNELKHKIEIEEINVQTDFKINNNLYYS